MLVVDGGGSLCCALLGDSLAQMAADHGWSGILVNGCVRDTAQLAKIPLGVKALAPCPLKSSKRDPGLRAVRVFLLHFFSCSWSRAGRAHRPPPFCAPCLLCRCVW